MRAAAAAGLLVLAGCSRGEVAAGPAPDGDIRPLRSWTAARVVPHDPALDAVAGEVGEEVVMVEAGARVMVVADLSKPDDPARKVVVMVRPESLWSADAKRAGAASVVLPRALLRPLR